MRQVRWIARLSRRHALLIAILAVQVGLSAHLIGSNTAFSNEATYLYDGHEVVTNGFNTFGYETYFSGSPLLYPVLAALVNHIGGLVAVRLVSLLFMLGSTVALYATATQLTNKRGGVFAAALFAVLTPTQFLGAFATYDAMALFLLTLSSWLVVKAYHSKDLSVWLTFAVLALAFANATKYATILYDPVVVGILATMHLRDQGWRKGLERAAFFVLGLVVVLGAGLVLCGMNHLRGFSYTTLNRGRITTPASSQEVWTATWHWIGVVLILVAIALVVATSVVRDLQSWCLLGLCAAASVLAPLNQARIGELTSLNKHVGFGAWFGCIAVGWMASKVTAVALVPIASAVVAMTAALAVPQSWTLYHRWPNSTALMNNLQPYIGADGHFLVEEPELVAYHFEDDTNRHQWVNTLYFSYKGLLGNAAYEKALQDHYFSLLVLNWGATPDFDTKIATFAYQHGYVIADRVKYGDRPGSFRIFVPKTKPVAQTVS
jgi:4-amino-4-deoxy-L-arabinose transferase-like glycosyltransferase